MKKTFNIIIDNYIDCWAVVFLTLFSIPFLWSGWGVLTLVIGTLYLMSRQDDQDAFGAMFAFMMISGILTFMFTLIITQTNSEVVGQTSTPITIKEITSEGKAIMMKNGKTVIYDISKTGAINHLNGKECTTLISTKYSWWDERSTHVSTQLDCEVK